MPIYEYKGQQYDITTEDPVEAKNKILGYLESQPVKEALVNSAFSPQEQAAAAAGPFSGIASILSRPSKSRPIAEPTLSPEEQVMGAIGAPSDAIVALAAPSAPKPPSEARPAEEFGKGVAGAFNVALPSMWEQAGVMKDVGALSTVRDRMDLFNKIETGEITSPDQLRGLDISTSQARAYLGADPEMREKIREKTTGEIGRRKDFVSASLKTLDQYQKDSVKYKGRTTDMTDVENVKDFTNWLAYNVGSGAVQLAPIMLAAVTTGPVGVAALGTTMGTAQALDDRLKFINEQIKNLPDEQKADAVIDYVKKTGGTSLAIGIINGALDTVLGPAATLAKRGLKEVVVGESKKQALKEGIKEVPKGMAQEFVTGGAQQATQIAGQVAEKERPEFFTKETLKEVFNAATAEAAGAIAGGAATTGARVYGAQSPEEIRAKALSDAIDAGVKGTTFSKSALDELVRTSLSPDVGILSGKNINIPTPSLGEIELPTSVKAKSTPPEEEPAATGIAGLATPVDLAGLAAAPSESMDTDFMLRELMGEPPKPTPPVTVQKPETTTPVTVEAQERIKYLEDELVNWELVGLRPQDDPRVQAVADELNALKSQSKGAPSVNEAPQAQQAKAQEQQAPAAPVVAAPVVAAPALTAPVVAPATVTPAIEATPVEDTPDVKSIREAYTEHTGKDFKGSPELADFKIARLTDAANQVGLPINVLQHQGQIITLATSVEPPARAKLIGTINPTTEAPASLAEITGAPSWVPENIWKLHEKVEQTGKQTLVLNAGPTKANATKASNNLVRAVRDHLPEDESAQMALMTRMMQESNRRKDAEELLANQEGVKPATAEVTPAAPAKKTSRAGAFRRASYDKNPFLTFLATHGLYHVKDKPGSLKREFSPDRQIMVSGYGPVFKTSGKQIDELLPLAKQFGYVTEDATETDLEGMIQSAVSGKRIEPLYSEQGALNIAAQYEERMAKDQADFEERANQTDDDWFGMTESEYMDKLSNEVANASDQDLSDIEEAIFDLKAAPASNVSMRSAMESLGFTEEEIQDEERRTAAKADEVTAREKGAGIETGKADQAAADEALAPTTPEGLRAAEERRTKIEADQAKAKKDAEARAKADEEVGSFTLTGSNRIADVAAAQGQKDIFAQEEEPAKEEAPPSDVLSLEYQGALEDSREAIADFRKAQQSYRDQKIDDKEFLVERRKYDLAIAKYDQAFAKEQEAVPEKVTQAGNEELLGPVEAPEAPQLTNEPYTLEGDFTEVGEEKQQLLLSNQSEKLTESQNQTLETQYGAKRGTAEFLDALRKDVIAFITQGAKAVNGKIRAIIRQVANGVLAVAIVFNPQYVSKPYTVAVPQYDISTSEVVKDLPKEAKTMSDAAKRAYGVIYPALEAQLKAKDKLFIVADKQSGNTYIFNPDGSLLLQSKTLFGKAIGDYMSGDNEIEANRITPAGVFDLGLRDAKRSEGEAATAGEYDFGKVFVLDKSYMGRNGPYSNTIMHSVWTNETDAKQRLAALNKPGAEDSRYSFGCINVNKETFKYLITNHLSQMDGAKIFIVPENGTNVMDFINGKAMSSDDIIRQRVEPVTKTTVTEKKVPAPKQEVERKLVGREEEAKVEVKTEETKEKKRTRQTFSSIEPESNNFKRWFGNSKVVDKAGNPLVVYHGTSGDFSEFSLGYRRDDQGNDQFGSGYYTTTSAEGASGYARGDGANVMPLFVSLQNPIDLDTPGFGREVIEKLMRASPEFKDAISNFGDINFSGEKKIVRDAVDVYEGYEEALPQISVLQRDFWPGDPEGFLKAAKKITGHDGVIVDNGGAGSFFVAWSPEQLKSATGNSGQYDPANPDIRYSIGRAGKAEDGEDKRSPSLKRDLKTLNRMRKDGRITDEQFVERADAAILADERDRLAEEKVPRQRGYLIIQEKLSAAARRGELTREAFDLANWFMSQNEALVNDLALSMKGRGKAGQGGSYSSFYRVATLIKSSGSDTTATHEILHHLERMMPPKIQQGIRKAWASQLVKAQKAAKTPAEKLYFAALMETHYGENLSDNIEIPKGAQSLYEGIKTSFKIQEKNFSSENLAQQLLIDAAVPLSNYEYFNPSEFWAVNGTDIVQARYEAVKGNTLARLKSWLRELSQKIKSFFGLKSDASIIRALDSLAKSDGKFVTKEMLGEGDYNQVIRNIRGNPAPTALWDSPEPSFMDGITYQLADKQIDTKRVVEQIQKTVGQIDERLDAYTKESLYSSRSAAQIEDFLDDKFSPLFEKMRDEKVTKDELEKYLHNRHAEERNEQINKINLAPDVQDIGSGIATADAQAYLSSLPANQKAKLKGLAAMVDDIIDGTQKILVDGGLETQETVDTWNKTYKHYIPLQRDDLDFVHTGSGYAGGVATKGSASKRAVGSIKPVKDILANVAIQREKAIRRSEQAKVGRALYGLAITSPNPGFWLPVNPNAIKNKAKLIQEMVSLGLTIQDAENLIQEPKVAVFDKLTGLVKYQVNPAMRNSENVFSVRINGEDRFIIFNPKDERAMRMARSLKNLDADELGWFLGNMGAVTRWIASVNTQYNPVFGAWNMARDVQSAALNLSTTEIAGKEKEVLKGTMPALFAIYKNLRGIPAKNKAEQEYMDLFQQMRRAGGTTGFAKQFSGQTENFGNFMERMKTGKPKEKVNIVEQELKKLDQGNARKAAQAVFNWLSDYNDAMENAVRVSAFKTALAEGYSEQKAASIAKELTVNFNRKGASSPTLQALYAFINASIQGSVRLSKTLRGPAGKKIIAGGIILGVAQALALALNGYDDGDPPEFLKDKNFIIPIPFAGDNYAIIPMPLGFNVFPGIGRILTEALLIQAGMLKSNKGVTDKLLGVGMLVLDSFNPLGAGSLTQMVTPTALDPIFAIAENKSAFGRPIYREDRDTQPTPGYQRSRDSATAVSQALAEFMNYVSSPSGSEYTKGRFSPTADEIDYLAGQYFGGVAREGIKLAETIKSGFTGEDTPTYRIPIVGKLYGETQSPAAVSSKFFDNITQMAKYENEIKKRIENNRPTDEYLENNPEAILWKRANKVESEVAKLNKTRSKYLEDDDMENVKRIDEMKNEKMKMFNDSVKEAQ